jgi:hypothetical protein
MLTTIRCAGVIVCLTTATVATPSAQAQRRPEGKTYAQVLVDDLVKRHPDVRGVELAVLTEAGCATLAATDQEDIGEKCDDDENGPIQTGEPFVEEPGAPTPQEEPEDKAEIEEQDLYDVTQALHDASGRLVGAVGIDIKPRPGQDRAAVVARAKVLLRELETRIASKEKLFERATGGAR